MAAGSETRINTAAMSLFFLALGLGFLSWSAYLHYQRSELLTQGHRTLGTIVRWEARDENNGGGRVYLPVIRYTPEGGLPTEFVSNAVYRNCGCSELRTGDVFPVLYTTGVLPAVDLEDTIRADKREYASLGLGIFFLLPGIYFDSLRRRGVTWLAYNNY